MPKINLKIILCGGDRREIELYRCWEEKGIKIKAAGFEQASAEIGRIAEADEADFAGAEVLIAPLSGVRGDGTVTAAYSAKRLSLTRCLVRSGPDLILLAGDVAEPLKDELDQKYRLVITGKDEELALLNAIPTAEGALQKAMELSTVTLHGSNVLVVGPGRCGSVLAGMLQGLGAAVRVLIRRRESGARAFACGFIPYGIEDAAKAVAGVDFIFNTAPAPILTADLLQHVRKGAVILDLASAPGGTDFDAASSLGLTALLLPSLPGRAAPLTSGRILARVYPRLIAEAQNA